MNKLQKDLYIQMRKNCFSTFYAVKEYAEKFKKYNTLTFRQLDEIVRELKK